jgi:hypothetical protein
MGNTLSDAVKRNGSNGSKPAKCARDCGAEIQPYAGRSVTRVSGTYAHHAGQCGDTADRQARTRSVAVQTSFAWSCAHVEPGESEPEICNVAGAERTEYVRHMRGHGKTPAKPTQPMIRLRANAKPAAPKFAPADVKIFKRLEWTETHEVRTGDLDSIYGVHVERTESRHTGQFWSVGEHPHSIWAVEDMRAAGLPNRFVELYVSADGSVTRDWSAAKSSRRRANAAERDRKRFAA